MDISKAKKLIELSKDNRSVILTLWEGGQITSCVKEAELNKEYCETCQANEELCQDYIDHLKEKGYEATEIELEELELEDSLPKFLEEREISAKPQVTVEPEATAEQEGE